MEEFPCDFSNAANDKNFFLVLKAFPSQIQIYFLDFFSKKSFSKRPKRGCTVFLYDVLYLRKTLEVINDRMRHRTGEAAKHRALGTFCVAFFPEAGSSLIVFCAVTPTWGWNRRCWAGPGAPGRASGRSQAPGGPCHLAPVPGGCRGIPGGYRAHL